MRRVEVGAAGITSQNTRSSRRTNFKLTPAPSYEPATTPEQSALLRRTRGRDWTTRTGSCAAAGGGPPASFDTTCALLRAWALLRVSGSDEHDAQPQKIYTTRQILHPLHELHGGSPETQPSLDSSNGWFLRWKFHSWESLVRRKRRWRRNQNRRVRRVVTLDAGKSVEMVARKHRATTDLGPFIQWNLWLYSQTRSAKLRHNVAWAVSKIRKLHSPDKYVTFIFNNKCNDCKMIVTSMLRNVANCSARLIYKVISFSAANFHIILYTRTCTRTRYKQSREQAAMRQMLCTWVN